MKHPAALLGVFTAGGMASLAAAIFVAATILGPLPRVGAIPMPVLIGLLLSAMLLGLSWILLRQEGESLAILGLVPTSVAWRQFIIGFAITTVLFLAIALAQSIAVGATWTMQGMPGVRAALIGLAGTCILALAEELLFRGVALRYLRALYGPRTAIVLSALIFGAYHLLMSDDWAMGAVYRFLMPAIGGLLFGWAALRSRGLALPLGLHLGGNWAQSSLAGFSPAAVTAESPVHALWRIPITGDDLRVLTAPDLVPHMPYLIAIAITAAMTWRLLRSSSPIQQQA